jgi:hypothetical protein
MPVSSSTFPARPPQPSRRIRAMARRAGSCHLTSPDRADERRPPRATDATEHTARPLCPGAGVVQVLPPSAGCRSASLDRRWPRRRAADPPAVPVLELRQQPHGFRGDGDGGDGPAMVVELRAGRRWPCVLKHGELSGVRVEGRGVPASPQRGECSSAGRFAAEQSGVAALRMMIGQIH